ncbi:TMEM175 family protein [Furfurilactobacillus siliginis]|nr:TMEM175 family protein [Furfurilactobacillus siliginis]GEK28769.1 membrane protein [Furfurilactobacillus siliginis]
MANKNMETIHNTIKEVRKNDAARLKEHLDVFNDAIIAIFITIMVLEVPLPKDSPAGYFEFFSSIAIFLISFFIVASFWYNLHNAFSLFKGIKKGVMILDFFFLAFLALIPIMTKWIMVDASRWSILSMGIVFLLVNIFRLLIVNQSHKELWAANFTTKYETDSKFVVMVIETIVINIILIIIAWFFPLVAMVAYIILPIMTFISN